MFTEDQKEIMKEAVDNYGDKHQIFKAKEELLELIKELESLDYGFHEKRYSPSIEELADVKIMVWQLEKILLKSEAHYRLYTSTLDYKLNRLKNRIEIEKGTEPPENKPPEPKSDNPSD